MCSSSCLTNGDCPSGQTCTGAGYDQNDDCWWYPNQYFTHEVASASSPDQIQIMGRDDVFVAVWQQGSGSSHTIRTAKLEYKIYNHWWDWWDWWGCWWGCYEDWMETTNLQTISGAFYDARNPTLYEGNDGYLLAFDAQKSAPGAKREAYLVWLNYNGSVTRGPIQISDATAVGRNAWGGAASQAPDGMIGFFWSERGSSVDNQALLFQPLDSQGTKLGRIGVVLVQEEWDFSKDIMPREATWVDGLFGVTIDTLLYGRVMDDTGRSCVTYEDCNSGEVCANHACMRDTGQSKYYYAIRYFAVCPP